MGTRANFKFKGFVLEFTNFNGLHNNEISLSFEDCKEGVEVKFTSFERYAKKLFSESEIERFEYHCDELDKHLTELVQLLFVRKEEGG